MHQRLVRGRADYNLRGGLQRHTSRPGSHAAGSAEAEGTNVPRESAATQTPHVVGSRVQEAHRDDSRPSGARERGYRRRRAQATYLPTEEPSLS